MSKIFKRLFLTYVLIIMVCIAILAPILGIALKKYYVARLNHELWMSSTLTTHIIKEAIIKGDQNGIQNKSSEIGKELNVRVTIIDINGTVLGDSEENPLKMENHKDRIEIREAFASKAGSSIRFSNTLKQDMMYVAVPVVNQSTIIGVVRFAMHLTDIYNKVGYIYKIILISSLLGISLALFLSIIISNRFVKPIRRIQDIAEKIIAGDLSQRIIIESKDELGNLAGYLNQMTDELRKRIEVITRDKKELEAILSNMVEGVMVISNNGRVILVNSPIMQMLDIRTTDVQGKHFWEIIRNEEINSLLKKSIETKQSLKKEIHIVGMEESYFEVQTSVILNDVDEILGVVGVFHNITEIKALDRMRSEFTANVSHELKTPLTSIKGFVETLLGGAINDKNKSQKFLNIIKKHTDRLESLIDDLLSIAKIESKEMKMNFKKIDVSVVINKVIDIYKDAMRKKNQTLKIQFKDELPPITADEFKLDHVCSNLLDNAIKFTPNNGTISVTAFLEKDSLRIDFQDTGIGISKEHLPHIFERFYRVDKTRSREMGGTGLGLSIVKHIVETHGGKVLVSSAIEKGSIFSVYLPL